MSQNIKKNCNNCKISFGCSILKEELVSYPTTKVVGLIVLC